MILRVAMPAKMQFKMIYRKREQVRGTGEIHYIQGADVLPPPLETEQESMLLPKPRQ